MGNGEFVVGALFRAIGKSSAITTDPWSSSNRTITHADHTLIDPGEIVMLVEYVDMDEKAGIWIWLLREKVVWQVLSREKYDLCWEPVEK